MEKRFEESFNELGLIYEAFATKAHGQQGTSEHKHSLRKGAFTSPSGAINQFAANMNNTSTTPVCDEEKEVDPIILKIEEMEKEAAEHGQDFAMLQLAELRRFIEDQ